MQCIIESGTNLFEQYSASIALTSGRIYDRQHANRDLQITKQPLITDDQDVSSRRSNRHARNNPTGLPSAKQLGPFFTQRVHKQ